MLIIQIFFQGLFSAKISDLTQKSNFKRFFFVKKNIENAIYSLNKKQTCTTKKINRVL